MKVTDTMIPDVKIIEPTVFEDERGFFFESVNHKKFENAIGRSVQFVQDNHSKSTKGVLRGLHYQLPPHAQGKLVRVVQGEVFDVAAGYDLLINGLDRTGSRKTDSESQLVGFKVPRFAEQLTKAFFSDPDYGKFPSFYSDEKVIHIFREPLDVVTSMIKLKATDDVSWLDKYGRSILDSMISFQGTHEILKDKMDYIKRRGSPSHLVGALYWEIKNQGYFDLLERGKPVCAVGYGFLVNSPENNIKRICSFLGVDWSDSLLNHPDHAHGELDMNGLAIGNTDPKRSIDTASVGSYKAVLNGEQIDEIVDFSSDMLIRLKQGAIA